MISRVLAKLSVAACCTIAFFNSSVFALGPTPPGSLTLAWDPSSDPGVVGYRLYQGGQSLIYTNVIDVGNSTVATVTGLVPGATYYFAVTAYDANGLESAFSGEISYTVPTSTVLEPQRASLSVTMGLLSQASLSGTAPAGYVYNVLATQDLMTWILVGTVTVDNNGTFQFADPVSSLTSSRFYRLEQIASQPSTTNPSNNTSTPLGSFHNGL